MTIKFPVRPVALAQGQFLTVTAGALLIFRVPFRGSFLVLFFSATLFLLTSLGCGVGHLAPDYARVLTLGLDGVMAQARRQMGLLDRTDPACLGERDFCLAAEEVCQAAIRFAGRYAELAVAIAEGAGPPCRIVSRGAAGLLVCPSDHTD